MNITSGINFIRQNVTPISGLIKAFFTTQGFILLHPVLLHIGTLALKLFFSTPQNNI